MAEKRLLLGDEAIALGAIHAGISGVYAYPGTPSTEITEFIQNNKLAQERNLHSRGLAGLGSASGNSYIAMSSEIYSGTRYSACRTRYAFPDASQRAVRPLRCV